MQFKSEYFNYTPSVIDKRPGSWSPSPNNLKIEFRYSMGPYEIMKGLQLDMGLEIEDYYWYNSFKITNGTSAALVSGDYSENKITIELCGENKAEILSHIRSNNVYRELFIIPAGR